MATRGGLGGGQDNWFDRGDDAAERELVFDNPEERLPWLESDDDGAEPPAYDTGRLVGFALVLLVVLAGVVGTIWLVTGRASDAGPEADGSLIEAPKTPYKVRPADAGGKTFRGTGDTSYAVGEGKSVEARLAPDAPPLPTAVPAPPAPKPTASKTPEPKPTKDPVPANSGALPAGTAVQVGAYSSRADAEAGWRRLQGQTEALSGVGYRIIAGKADIGTVHRLQAVGGDKANAAALCTRLKSAGIACQVK